MTGFYLENLQQGDLGDHFECQNKAHNGRQTENAMAKNDGILQYDVHCEL